ncbi:hypothetical protein EYB25_000725 [Talaromyces marneffei]|nr:hypothetical protein EYB25_000725 [Talaromyces marneffei]
MNVTLPTRMVSLDPEFYQSPVTIGLGTILAAILSLFAFVSYTPRVDKRVPKFTSDTYPFIGAANFMWRKGQFLKDSFKESKTGHFSFWVGKKHVVGVSGEAGRKAFLEGPGLDFVQGSGLRGVGLRKLTPIPEIFKPNFHNGRSYFLRRLIDMQKSEVLRNHLARLTSDTRKIFQSALAKDTTGVTNPAITCARIVYTHDMLLFCCQEIADDTKIFEELFEMYNTMQAASSFKAVFFPWIPSTDTRKRAERLKYLQDLFDPVVERRMRGITPRQEDGLQFMIDSGDKKANIADFFVSIIFIAPTNSRILMGQMLHNMASHQEWQEKVHAEIKAAAKAHAKNPNAPLVEQLDSLPLDVWETSFPTLDICFKEAIRMWVVFSMMRKNIGSTPIELPGSNEVIPAGSYAIYNTAEIHLNPELYPEPTKYKPERWLPGNDYYKKVTYGFLGWGDGRHPCPGKRWAKLQSTITVAYALAGWKWMSIDDGIANKSSSDGGHGTVLSGKLLKFVSRDE